MSNFGELERDWMQPIGHALYFTWFQYKGCNEMLKEYGYKSEVADRSFREALEESGVEEFLQDQPSPRPGKINAGLMTCPECGDPDSSHLGIVIIPLVVSERTLIEEAKDEGLEELKKENLEQLNIVKEKINLSRKCCQIFFEKLNENT